MGQNLKQHTKSGLYWKFLDLFSGYGIQFILGIIMARLLSPRDYGIAALPALFFAIADIVQNGGLHAALVRKQVVSERDLSTSFYYSFLVGVSSYAILFVSSPWIAAFFNTPILTSLIRVSAISFLWCPLSTPQLVLLDRKLDFKTQTKTGVFCKLFSGVIGITIAFMGYGVWALVISELSRTFFRTAFFFILVKWHPKSGFSKESFKYLWGFGNKMMLSSLIDAVYVNITTVFIGKFFSPAKLGVYNRSQGYASMPSKHVTSVIQGVTYPILSKINNDDDERLAADYRRILKVSAFVIFPVMMLLSALARPLIITMITAKWEECILLLQIMCFSMLWYPINVLNLTLLQVKGRSDLFLRLEIIKKIVGVSVLAITLPMGLIAICIGEVVCSVFFLVISTHYNGRLISFGFLKQIKELLPTFALSLFMFFTVRLFLLAFDNMWVQVFGGGVIGIAIYWILAVMFKFSETDDVKYLLRK